MKGLMTGLNPWINQLVFSAIIGLFLGAVDVSQASAAPFPIATGGAASSFSFDGTNYLVGVVTPMDSTPAERSHIGAQLVSATGEKLGALIDTGRTGVTTNIAFDGTNYLLTWEDDGINVLGNSTLDGTTGFEVWGQFIDKTGTKLGSAFKISSSGIWFDGNKSMTYGGGKYLVTYTKLIVPANADASNNRYIAGQLVDPTTKQPVGGEIRINAPNTYGAASDVGYDGSKFFVIWREDSLDTEVRGRFVSPAGVLGNEISINASAAPSDGPMSLTFDGTNYLVVWNDQIDAVGPQSWDVFGQRVSPTGTLIGGVLTISNEPGPQMATSVAYDGTNYLVVWMDMSGVDWNMYGQYINTSGVRVGSKVTINTDATNQMGGVGFTNGKYLVLVNNGVVMGEGGVVAVTDATGLFIVPTPPLSVIVSSDSFHIATNGAAQSFSFDGTNYLIGVESHTSSPPTIGAQMISTSGSKVGSFISTGRTGIATNLAFDGTNYLLTWEDDNGGTANGNTGWQVWGQRISKAGALVGDAYQISSSGVWFDGNKSMTFGGGKYLVTYTKLIVPANGDASTNRYIAGTIVNPDGSKGSEFRISTGFGAASDVGYDGTNFFVIWREDSTDTEVRGRFVSPAGVLGNEISINASAAPSDNPMSLAFDGTNYLVVWNDEVGGVGTYTWDVFGQRVSPTGTLIGGVVTISNEPGPQMATSVAYDGTNYLVVWMDMNGVDWNMYGQYLNTSGVLLGSKITISNDATNQMGGAGFANGKYLVLVNSGVIMGEGGISSVDAVYGVFLQQPVISSITPITGLVGATVTISGFSFAPDATVSFNGIPAVVSANTGSQLTVTVPVGATTGVVTVTTAGITIAGSVFTPRYTLSEGVVGNGQINGTFSCLSGTCSNSYDFNTPIALAASESYGSIFSAWSGGTCSGTVKNSCSFNLTSDKSVIASFAKLNNVKVTTGVESAYYDTLTNAFGVGSIIATGSIVKAVRTALFDFNGETLTNTNVTVSLTGGYDATFENYTGYFSTVKGPLKVSSGKLIVANIKVKP